jgi:eukaryotic-like serine/threonine-protein kinase
MEEARKSASNDVERRIAAICDQFAQEIRDGRRPDVDKYVCGYREYAPLLRPALHAVQSMVRFAAESTTLVVGSTLGEFRLTRFIARGGMGLVYEAEQIALCRKVALKVLPEPEESKNAEALLVRFRNEVRAAAALDHPNIVPIYSSHSELGRHYFAMKLIDGITWSQWSAEQKRPDPIEVALDLNIVAEALAHAHQRGIVHRDIKPSNIMRDSHGKT